MCATNRRFLLHWNVRTPHCQRRVLYPCKDSEELEYDSIKYDSIKLNLQKFFTITHRSDSPRIWGGYLVWKNHGYTVERSFNYIIPLCCFCFWSRKFVCDCPDVFAQVESSLRVSPSFTLPFLQGIVHHYDYMKKKHPTSGCDRPHWGFESEDNEV